MWGKGLKLWFCDFDHFGLAILANFSNLFNLGKIKYLVLGIFANFTNP